ncbi:redox-sensing transcriptional repressor Rex [uncultured Muribaculum sp.]|uniref:redox-sensing transcriptional repressor Rex n=1 Tax=uncultured Muribaculum sp. TaxID=1918613 RepID=UPI0025CC0343|nr:redox-sensing transcriptional repressor Rex [uncultured Muribaculum sp.]
MNDNIHIQSSTPIRELPEPTLRRLPWYLAYVGMLKERGVEYVSSTQISKEINVDASMIAKDLSFLNIRGKTRIGYEVSVLDHELQDFLGFKRGHNAVMIGVGSLGASLISDSGLVNYGLRIVAGFDINPEVVDTSICDVPIYDMKHFSKLIPSLNAEIGIIAVPIHVAQQVSDTLVEAGIKALWNFTPFRITAPEGIVITNTSIYAHLAVMYNRLGLQSTLRK